jgi:hypothetical protein
MIPHKIENEFKSSGLTREVKSYTFQMNAHMASLLSDTLYSDKPTACWRELVANAYDSHTEANNPNPPVIHMCTALEPWIEIADQGVGLDEVEFEEVFTSYGGSTKRATNVTVGNKGLGSKVFFAYTSQATIVCVKDGIKRTFSIFKDDTGMPSHNMLNSQSTNEPNGVNLSFGVLPGDIGDFQEKAKQVFRRYNPLPIIEGMVDFVPEPYETIMEGNGWVLRKEEELVGYQHHSIKLKKNQPYAIQGNIAYPINNDIESGMDDKVKFMLDVPFDITFPIGQLETANSREALSYNQETIDNIAAMFLKIYDEISTKIMPKVFVNCTTKWETIKALADFTKDIENVKYKELVRGLAQWDGEPVKSSLRLGWKEFCDVEHAALRSVSAHAMGERRFALQTMNMGPDVLSSYAEIELMGKRKYLIIIAKDDEKRIPSRLKQYMFDTYGEAHKRGRYDRSDKDKYPVVLFIKLPHTASILKFVRLLKGHEWHMFDKLVPEYPILKAVRGSGSGMGVGGSKGPVNRRVMVFNEQGNYNSNRLQWDTATIDTNTQVKGYYVDLRKWCVKSDIDFLMHWNIYRIVDLATTFGILDGGLNAGPLTKATRHRVYGVPGGQKNELALLPGWIELTSEIDRVQKKWEKAKTTSKEITFVKVYDVNKNIGRLSEYLKKHKITDNTGSIKMFLNRTPLDTTAKLYEHINLTKIGVDELFDKRLAEIITNEFDAVNSKYPMLKHMDLVPSEVDDIKNYVKLVSKS